MTVSEPRTEPKSPAGTIRVTAVVAIADNGVIGRDGGLPWRQPSDLKVFRRLTLGRPVIMGRRTFQSIGRPLEGRTNIVVTRDPNFSADGVVVVAEPTTALDRARDAAAAAGGDEVVVIGGAQLYLALAPLTDRAFVTRIHGTPDGDTRLTCFDGPSWTLVSTEPVTQGDKDTFAMTLEVRERTA